MTATPAASEPPEAGYRRRFLDMVMATQPASVLDVGCGDGGFVRAIAARGCRAAGTEIDAASVAALTRAGIAAQCARAEALPFPDRAFDAAVMQYVPHHCTDLAQALRELVRISARNVLILEGWYDETIPSQRVARDYERWSKAIDRRLGMVHADCLEAGEMIAMLQLAPLSVAVHHDLVLRERSVAAVRAAGETQLARLGGDAPARDALAAILAAAGREGISESGALMLAIAR